MNDVISGFFRVPVIRAHFAELVTKQPNCPTGKSLTCLSSPSDKNIPVHF
jgi:hypothetical protein